MGTRETIQYLLAAGAVKETELETLWNKKEESQRRRNNIQETIQEINDKIENYGLLMKRIMMDNGVYYIGIANTIDTFIDKMNTFKPIEIIIIRTTLEKILKSPDGDLHRSDFLALRSLSTENGDSMLSINQMQELLEVLLHSKWIASSIINSNSYTIGPRVWVELTTLLHDFEIPSCAICSYEVLQGVNCNSCSSTRLHLNCLEEYMSDNNVGYPCSHCSEKIVLPPRDN